MKSVLKLTLIYFSFFSFLFFFPFKKTAFAQGTYSCSWSNIIGCKLLSNNCSSGYQPGNCPGDSLNNCNKTYTCISNPPPVPTPQTPTPNPNPCNPANPKVWTALGCIPTGSTEFVSWLLARAILLGGGLAFLLMIWGSFQVLTSSGDPQKLQNGKEVFTSAISGLLFIILSLFLLRLIGVDILKIPGFTP